MKCPYCGSSRTIKAGKRRNKYVTKQGYRCKDCGRFFIERDGFEGMTYPKEIVLESLHLYARGLSLSDIRDFLWQHRGYKPAESRILEWTRKYAKLLKRFEQRLKPKAEGRVHLDEVELKIGRRKCYCIHAIDSGTRYNLESVLSWRRDLEAFRRFFRKLKERIGEQVRAVFRQQRHKPARKRKLVTFVSDKWGPIERAFNAFFYRIAKLVRGVPIACRRYGLRFNNNPIERHNQHVKQRYKVMRCFKSFASAEAFLTLYRAVYNFVRSHKGLNGRTPADRAIVNFSPGRDRLACLIAIAVQ